MAGLHLEIDGKRKLVKNCSTNAMISHSVLRIANFSSITDLISHQLRYSSTCRYYADILYSARLLIIRPPEQYYVATRLKSSLPKVYHHHYELHPAAPWEPICSLCHSLSFLVRLQCKYFTCPVCKRCHYIIFKMLNILCLKFLK